MIYGHGHGHGQVTVLNFAICCDAACRPGLSATSDPLFIMYEVEGKVIWPDSIRSALCLFIGDTFSSVRMCLTESSWWQLVHSAWRICKINKIGMS